MYEFCCWLCEFVLLGGAVFFSGGGRSLAVYTSVCLKTFVYASTPSRGQFLQIYTSNVLSVGIVYNGNIANIVFLCQVVTIFRRPTEEKRNLHTLMK